jgi:hypothetical protein
MTDMVRVPQAGETAGAGFGSQMIERKAETASAALAEQAKAAVQARYIMALQRPRDLMQARERLLTDCKRPIFADAAIYHKPVGDGVEGPSIRMAEAAARALTNILTSTTAIFDDAQKRIIHVSATDLEANITYDRDVTVAKTIERSRIQEGRRLVGQRVNSRGNAVYIYEATDEEILDKENALASKAMRVCLLRLVPGDLLEEAISLCYATMENRDAADPAAALKRLCDSFAALGVNTAALADYLGHGVDQLSEDERKEMRGVYAAIKDGEATWTQCLEHKRARRAAPAEGKEKTPAPEAKGDATKPATLADAAAKSKASREKTSDKAPVVKLEGTDGKQMDLKPEPGSEG